MKSSMNIKALALAVAAAFAAPAAFADNVQVYGLVDVGYLHQDAGHGAKNSISSETGSGAGQLGFKGSEDLGNGLKASFQIEYSVLAAEGGSYADGAGVPQLRQSWVALGGDFGTLTLGRDYAPTFITAFGGEYCGWCGLGSIAGMTKQGLRNSNMVKYNSPSFGGFGFAAAHTTGEQLGSSGGNVDEASLSYSGGPVNVSYAHRDAKNTAATVKQKSDYLAGNVSFGIAKVYALWGKEKASDSSVNESYASLGASFKLGGGDLALETIRVKDKTAGDSDSKMASIGYFYFLSKRTTVYAQYSKVTNDSNVKRDVYVGSDGLSLVAGDDPKQYTIGLRHTF
ncbi:MAG: porin [Burkholderiaceae bacterium]|nr:MAG: porin [Burkholderiaceae bacterium]